MPSFAGFHVSHEDCREWLKKYRPDLYERDYSYGAAPVITAIEKLTPTLAKHSLVETELVRPPGTDGSLDDRPPADLMLIRRYSSRKVYMPPKSTGFDANGKELIEKYLDLKVSDWKVLWFDKHDSGRSTKFLEPRPE